MAELKFFDNAGDSFRAFNQGREIAQQRRTSNALAGYDAAKPEMTLNALIQGGDVQTASQLQNHALTGDYRTQQIEAQRQAQLAKHHDYVEAEAGKLQGILAQQGPEAMLQAFDANLPTYQQMGEDPQALSTLRQLLTVNPEAALAGLAGVRKPDIRQSGRFIQASDPMTGKKIYSYELPQDQKAIVMRDANGNRFLVDPDTREVIQTAQAPKQFAPKSGRGGAGGGGMKLPTGFVLDGN